MEGYNLVVQQVLMQTTLLVCIAWGIHLETDTLYLIQCTDSVHG